MEFILGLFFITLIIVCITVLILISKIKTFTQRNLGISNFAELNDLIEKSEIEVENTPKSLTSMESIYLPKIKKDFPNLNVNELKRIAEKFIIEFLNSCESGDTLDDSYMSDKIKVLLQSKIEDYNKENIHFDSIKIHRTVIGNYEYGDGIITILFNTSLEYYTYKSGESRKKVQDRFKTEFIYVIDNNKVGNVKKSIGLNCPNCGAPVKKVGHKTCDYCGAGVVDIVKKNWILNNLTRN